MSTRLNPSHRPASPLQRLFAVLMVVLILVAAPLSCPAATPHLKQATQLDAHDCCQHPGSSSALTCCDLQSQQPDATTAPSDAQLVALQVTELPITTLDLLPTLARLTPTRSVSTLPPPRLTALRI